jgi:MFS family permease
MPKTKGVKNDEVNLLQDLAEVWKHKNIIYLSIFAGLMVGPLEGFADAWGAAFMQSVYNMDKTTASFLTSLMFLGMAVGSSIIAYIGDKTKAYYKTIVWCAFLMASIFGLLLAKTTTSSPALMAMFIIIGILSGYQVLAVYLSTTFVKEGVIGLTTAIVNMIIMSFGYLFHSAIGKILSLTWDGSMIDEVKIYTPESYIYSIYVIPACLIAGGIGFIWIKIRTKQR